VFVLNGGKQIATKKADSKGNFSIPISAYKPGTKLTVYVINTNKIESDPVTITVATLATPKVSAVKQNAKALSGTAEAGTTAYVKYNSKVVASAKVSSKGKFTIKIKGYKKGVKLYVYVKNAYGYSSASKVVTVSK